MARQKAFAAVVDLNVRMMKVVVRYDHLLGNFENLVLAIFDCLVYPTAWFHQA